MRYEDYREQPDPDATFPSGMCGEPKVCDHCPSHFLCYNKASAEHKALFEKAALMHDHEGGAVS